MKDLFDEWIRMCALTLIEQTGVDDLPQRAVDALRLDGVGYYEKKAASKALDAEYEHGLPSKYWDPSLRDEVISYVQFALTASRMNTSVVDSDIAYCAKRIRGLLAIHLVTKESGKSSVSASDPRYIEIREQARMEQRTILEGLLPGWMDSFV